MNRDVLHVKKKKLRRKRCWIILCTFTVRFVFQRETWCLCINRAPAIRSHHLGHYFFERKKNTFSSSKLKQACCVVCVSSQPFYWIISSRQLLMPVYIKRLYSPASVIITRGCWSGSRSSMRKSSPKSGSLVPSTVSDAGNLYRKIYLCCSIFDYFSSVFTILWFTLSKTKH